MFEEVDSGKLQVWSHGARTTPRHSGAAMISLYGVRGAVRAAWAKLADRTTRLSIGTDSYYLDKDVAYMTINAPLPQTGVPAGLRHRDLQHTILAHPTMSPLRSTPNADFLVPGGEGLIPRFFARLDAACPVPFRASWARALWDAGLAGEPYQRPIHLCPGFGLEVYQVSVAEDVWHTIVKTLLASKGIA